MRLRSSIVLLLLAALLFAACSGGDDEDGGVTIGTPEPTASPSVAATNAPTRTATATPTPSATATPAPTLVASPCPAAPEACSFMSQVAQNVIEGDSGAVLSLSKPTIYTCPGPNGGPGGPFPLCNGARIGEVRFGFAMRRLGGEAGIVAESEVVPLLAGWAVRTEPGLRDEYGDGDARAFTVACPGIAPTDSRNCRDRFSLVFSGLSPGASAGDALRTMLAIDVRRDGDEYHAVGFATGVLESGLYLPLRGGSATVAAAAPAAALIGGPADWTVVTYFPWTPIGLPR